ncbi:peptidoglycan-binding protein [Geoalkalibacter sp.]|uniref:peptidoglycan-binding protein n=1 Tax=Geoalkalibacter sp. TaxID=3041440 RepID=UPI00272E1B18|nr:peptidoglycan-binding protein [Geoalkalibacter sp.]
MAPRPMLDDLELQQVQFIDSDQEQILVGHGVPALEGDFWQGLGRRAGGINLAGVLSGAEAAEGLGALREKFHAAAPVSFVADIAAAVRVDQVLIESMEVREIAGRPLRFEYAFRLREYIPPPPPRREIPPPPPPPPPRPDTGILEVEVLVEGQPDFDHSQTVVTVEGEQEDGAPLSRTLVNRDDNVWREEDFPPGAYTCRARVEQPQLMTGEARATVRPGETTRALIRLRPGGMIAKAFVVHFWFDKAFIEPCLRGVLRRVAEYAANHPDEKMVIVGHTDLVGSDAYNQSLSERRGRAVYAWLTAGRDPAASRAEWDALRRARPAGQLPSIHDTWSVREYQFILNDLEYYKGGIDEDHGPLTSEAIRNFQLDQGLPQTGQVNDATWSALIAAYLDQDRLAVAENQFLPNAGDGCSNGVVKWLGGGEKDPVRNTQDAWRPNRRTEILFVRASQFPCEVPQPATWNLPSPGGAWCIGPGDPNQRTCFIARGGEQPNKWLVVAAESGQVSVSLSLTRPDGSAVPNEPFALMAPDGEYLHTDAAGRADVGERPSGPQRGRPIPNRTAADGSFRFPDPRPEGTYILHLLELRAPAVARLADAPPQSARGNIVCRRLEGSTPGHLPVVIEPGPTPAVTVNPTITLASDVVVVRKVHTNPARVQVRLGVSSAFTGNGTLTRIGNFVDLFPSAVGGVALTYDGVDNLFSGAQLSAGLTLFAEGTNVSGSMNDVQLSLTLTGGTSPIGPPVIATLTALELTLDVALSRTATGVDPPLLSAAQKIDPGRFVQVRDPGLSHERAMLIVRPPQPSGFTGTLVLTPLDALNPLVRLFTSETPAAADVATGVPHPIPAATVPASGARLFVEARTFSPAARDTGFRLGIQGGEPDGDRVNMTAVQVEISEQATAAAPSRTFTRIGLWNNGYDAAGDIQNQETEANNFVGADRRKFHFRIHDPVANGSVAIDWKTLRNDRRTDDDAPVSQVLTLPETAAGSRVFISRGVLLVTDDTDRDFPTHSGLAAPFDTGLRNAGQSNHRTRRALIDGFVRAEYSPSPGVRLPLLVPVFNRNPDERRRLAVRVIRYTNVANPGFAAATPAYIAGQFLHANRRWNQIGLQIDAGPTTDRQVPAAALNGAGIYAGSADNANEQAALNDLVPLTPDNTLTVVFVPLSGANAYATIAQRVNVALGDRYFIFIDTTLSFNDETLAHELAHVLFNRFDTATDRRFFTLNTNSPTTLVQGTGIVLPDVRIYRRIQNLHTADPDNDPNNDNIINWARRARTARFPIAAGLGPATATTGNNLIQNF